LGNFLVPLITGLREEIYEDNVKFISPE